MRIVLTGAAGFMGTHLCDLLLASGHEVVGIDSFSDYYDRGQKEGNIEAARSSDRFTLYELDLAEAALSQPLDGAVVVFHLAGRCGLGTFAASDFSLHVHDNVLATHRLLDAVTAISPIPRFVFADSSSVYGEAERFPTKETAVPLPVSSYGVTKLTGENLVRLYTARFGLHATTLRYFTVYGPRQRPDMAIARFIQALAGGDEIEVFGDGDQTRDFTYIADAIEATVLAVAAEATGLTMNIGGGSHASVNEVLAELEEITGAIACRSNAPAQPHDPRHAAASINIARRVLCWEPRTSLRAGLAAQWSWFRQRADMGLYGEVRVAV